MKKFSLFTLSLGLVILALWAAQATPAASATRPAEVLKLPQAEGRADVEPYLPLLLKTEATSASHPLTDPIVIDGVFSGELVDGDGSASPGAGTAHPTKFVEQKKFDAADSVYYEESDGTGDTSPGDNYWIDNDGDGVYSSTIDALVLGTPSEGTTGALLDALTGVTTITVAYNDAEIDDNNRYDDGEDIYVVDSAGEFRGAMQRVIRDPLYPGANQVLAHLYIAAVTDTVFMHNDFIVDAEATWIDGDGTATSGAGTQAEIGFPVFTNTISSTLSVQLFGHWFSSADDVYWKSTGSISGTWATGDSLWLDAADDGVYSSTVDAVILSSGALSDGDRGQELNSDGPTPTYNFTYDDADGDDQWDDGEDIATLDGDETYDWNYFDDRWSWLVDGDGTATDGRGTEDETRIDGNTWFQASDQVYHWDADGNGDWNTGDGLWIDGDGNRLFSGTLDSAIVRGDMAGGEIGKLLQVDLVDGDGDASAGAGAENGTRRGQSPFAPTDDVFWYDVQDNDNWFWSDGDGLWIDDDGDGLFTAGADRVLVSGTLSSGVGGVRLSASAHHFGYDDGEVALNGQYDPGEDIYAANTYLAYDDLEIDFNSAYDPGEDVYDRDYIEIWVYAEGDAAQVPTDMYHPDREPGLRDVGFRVHVNGIRVDDPGDDYDAPTGFQAAAGWGYSRGAPAWPAGGYNRHYEYKLPSAAADAPLHLRSNGARIDNKADNVRAPNAPRVWETDHKIDWETCEMTWVTHWKDIRRGRDNFQGFGSANGQREESVMLDFLHPPPPPPPAPPIVVKESLGGPIFIDPSTPTSEGYNCWSIFIYNPSDQPLGEINLQDHLPEGWAGNVQDVTTDPPGIPVDFGGFPSISLPDGLPPGGWVEITVCASGPVEATAKEVVNAVDGEVDDDNDPGTDPVPIPGDSSGVPVVSLPEVLLFKWPEQDEVTPGSTVTWRIGVANVGRVPVDEAELKDDVPDGLKPKTQSGTQPSGTDVSLPLETLGHGAVRIVNLQTEVSATLAPSTTLTNTLTLSGEFSVPAFNVFAEPYSTTVSASVHVTAPASCQACIQGRVTFTDCTRPASQAALGSATVNIKRDGNVVATVETDENGNYQYCFDVPPTDGYSVEVLLQEGGNKFRVLNGDGGPVPRFETPQFDVPACVNSNPEIVTQDVNLSDTNNASNVPNHRRQALAAIFYETEIAADFWQNEHGVNLASPGPNVAAFSAAGTSYLLSGIAGTPGTIRINAADSACRSNNRPMNREWHEFNHYVDELVGGIPARKPGDVNHGGFNNSDSSDSHTEGWAEFWSNKTGLAEGQARPELYRMTGGAVNLEDNYKARSRWGAQSIEELAVASLLWDLHDSGQDNEPVRTTITNTSPPPPTTTVVVTYTDHISLTNQRIYDIINTRTVTNVKGLYDALKAEGVGQGDADGDGTSDLDELFVMHGFWGDDGDGVYEPQHGDGAVGWAGQDGRYELPVPFNASLLLSVTMPGGSIVPTTTLNVDVRYDSPYSSHSFSYTHMLWTGDEDVEAFVPPLPGYTATLELWVTHGVSESDHLRFGNGPYWSEVNGAAVTTTHALTHTFCLGGAPLDVNCDGVVSVADAEAVAANEGSAYPELDYRPGYDLDGDGDVDGEDYQIIATAITSITLATDPTSIAIGGATSHLTATVTDAFGSAILDGTPVIFTTNLGSLSGAGGAGTVILPGVTAGGIATATLTSGDVPGTATVTATANSRVATATVTFTTTLCVAPLTGVRIDGPTTGEVGNAYAFSAVISPTDATPPVSYTWTPTPTLGQGATVTYTWQVTGPQTLAVYAVNCGGTFSDTHDIEVEAPRWSLYLPLVLNDYTSP